MENSLAAEYQNLEHRLITWVRLIQIMVTLADDILTDWALAAQDDIKDVVQKSYPLWVYRWPILRAFEAKGYNWKGMYLMMYGAGVIFCGIFIFKCCFIRVSLTGC
jgi:hypothetical protein